MTYYLINSYGGYAKGVEVYKLQAKNDNEAYKKADGYGQPFAVTTLLRKRDARRLLHRLGQLVSS